MNPISECTIVIPTHERSDYLARCVRWFSGVGSPVVIADSSARSSSDRYARIANVTYIHLPGGFEVYPSKLALALEHVQTPFVAMCADDDFITTDGLRTSVSFLQANEDYVFSQGYAYLYQTFGHRPVLWPMVYLFHNNQSDDWLTRVENAKSTIYYGVNRTSVLRNAVGFVLRQDFSELTEAVGAFADTALAALVARAGKFKRCEVPFAFREYSTVVKAVGYRFEGIVSRNLSDFYRNLVDSLMAGTEDCERRRRLVRLFAADFAGQISYDLAPSTSWKARLSWLPQSVLPHAEYCFRLYKAGMMYRQPHYRPFLRVFSTSDYRRFKTFVIPGELS